MLKITDLCFTYTDGTAAIRNLSLTVGEGEKTGIIGPNGAGKTTLFLLCCGILSPEKGSIILNGSKVKSGAFNPEIGYLFQSPDDQLFSPSIYEDTAFGPRNMGITGRDLEHTVVNALKRVNALHLKEKPSQHLSGGEKRIAAIATLLSMNPKVMLFDEPTANLDTRNKRNVINLIQDMNETLIISSHDLEFLLETCTRVVLIDEGILIADGEIRRIMSDARMMSAHGLEKPHSLMLHQIKHDHHTQ